MFKVDVVTASPQYDGEICHFHKLAWRDLAMPISEEGQYLSKSTTIMVKFAIGMGGTSHAH